MYGRSDFVAVTSLSERVSNCVSSSAVHRLGAVVGEECGAAEMRAGPPNTSWKLANVAQRRIGT